MSCKIGHKDTLKRRWKDIYTHWPFELKLEREYDKRTTVERVNSRLDASFGFEQHYIRGKNLNENMYSANNSK
nr:hypothetical protein [Mahella sp.]